MCKLFVFDKKTQNHIAVCKLFVLRIVIQRYNCSLRNMTSYLKSKNCEQTNDYYQIELITWNHIIFRNE